MDAPYFYHGFSDAKIPGTTFGPSASCRVSSNGTPQPIQWRMRFPGVSSARSLFASKEGDFEAAHFGRFWLENNKSYKVVPPPVM